ncbi:PAS domain S-box protein [Alsobacter sp. R-9]
MNGVAASASTTPTGDPVPALHDSQNLAVLYRLTDRLYRAVSLADVFDAALDIICEAMGCSRASILLFDDDGVMRFVAWRGLSEVYRHTLDGHSPWVRGQKNAEPIFVGDIRETAEPDWVKERIVSENILGLAFIPLVAGGAVVGKFMTYYACPRVFGAREVDLAVTIARQVGFSVERARAEEARRAAEEALRFSEERSRMMLENAPVMIWMSDASGKCLHLNRKLREFWGVDEATVPDFEWTSTMHPEDAPAIGAAMARALGRQERVRTSGRFLDARGRWRVLNTDAEPRRSQNGAFLGMIGVNIDVTEREEAEQAILASEQRFRLVFESAPSGMILTDADGAIRMVNAQAERLFGYVRDEFIGMPAETLMPRDAMAPLLSGPADDNAQVPGRNRSAEIMAVRKDATTFPAEMVRTRVPGDEGLCLTAIVDISERRAAEMQRELLLAELNHRVKNTLAVVQGIAHQTFKGADVSAGLRGAFNGRLAALAGAHDMLTRTHWSHARLDELADEALGLGASHRSRIEISGPPLMLDPKAALAIAMALHELSTNAVKYGALSNDRGRVRLNWTSAGTQPDRFHLQWIESGGPTVRVPEKRGFGSRLIEHILASDLDGRVEFRFLPEGVTCAIEGAVKPGVREDPR